MKPRDFIVLRFLYYCPTPTPSPTLPSPCNVNRGYEFLLFKSEEAGMGVGEADFKIFYGNRVSGVVEFLFPQLYFGGSLAVCFPMTSDSPLSHLLPSWSHRGVSGCAQRGYQEVIPMLNSEPRSRAMEIEITESKHLPGPHVPHGCFYSLRYTKLFTFYGWLHFKKKKNQL